MWPSSRIEINSYNRGGRNFADLAIRNGCSRCAARFSDGTYNDAILEYQISQILTLLLQWTQRTVSDFDDIAAGGLVYYD